MFGIVRHYYCIVEVNQIKLYLNILFKFLFIKLDLNLYNKIYIYIYNF
jgi:hypothetical protein